MHSHVTEAASHPHQLFASAPVESTGSREGMAIACGASGSTARLIRSPVYELLPEAKELRETRLGAGLSQRDASRLLGLTTPDYSQVECGERRFVVVADYAVAIRRLHANRRAA